MIPVNSVRILWTAGMTKRLHTVPTDARNLVSEHSWGVALILLTIYPTVSVAGLARALIHDCAESVTGDVPAPTKWASAAVSTSLETLEIEYEKRWGVFYDLSPEEEYAIKVADMLDLLMFCHYREILGDKSLLSVKRNVQRWWIRQSPTIAEALPSAQEIYNAL